MHLIDSYGADSVRYWAASARLGVDTAFDEKALKIGKRLVTKLWNAARFVGTAGGDLGGISHELDRAFLHQLRAVIEEATGAFAAFDYAGALAATESFFWRWFADTYLELVKGRVRGEGAGHASAVASLRLGLDVLLRLFAPMVPFVTEEIWSASHSTSIHRAPWPEARELAVPPPLDAALLPLAGAAMSAINKRKTESGASVGRVITALMVAAHPETLARLAPAQEDLLAAVRAQAVETVARPEAAPGTFEVLRCELAAASADGAKLRAPR
jgi:valyl-tRNA synthetase